MDASAPWAESERPRTCAPILARPRRHGGEARGGRWIGLRAPAIARCDRDRLLPAPRAVYLALGDDLQAVPPRRSVPRAVCALAAGVVLALAVPLAWVSPAPRDQPAATVAGKAAGVEIDDEDAGGPWPSA